MYNKIYLAGPISGRKFKKEVTPHFKYAEEFCSHKFRTEIKNPVDHKLPSDISEDDKQAMWQYFMREGIKSLLECDTIFLLKGWERSKGARIEAQIAAIFDMTVLYEQDYYDWPY